MTTPTGTRPNPPKRWLSPNSSISGRSDSKTHMVKGLLVALVTAVLVLIGIHSFGSSNNRFQNDPAVDFTKPILLMGLPKSGSEAIHKFFQCFGITSYHYCCDHRPHSSTDTSPTTAPSTNVTNAPSSRSSFPCQYQTCGACLHRNMMSGNGSQDPFTGCASNYSSSSSSSLVVFSQLDVESKDPFGWFLPQRFTLPLLEAHSGLWILNQRSNAQDWATHVLHWYSITQRLFHAFGLSYYDVDTTIMTKTATSSVVIAPTSDLSVPYLQQELDRSLERARNITEHQRRHRDLVKVYEQHATFVEQFAKRHHHALLLLNVDDDPASTSLALAKALRLDLTMARRCWKFDPEEYEGDWQDFQLKL